MASPKNWDKLDDKKFYEAWQNRENGDLIEMEHAGGSWYVDLTPKDGEIRHIGEDPDRDDARKIATKYMRENPR